MRARTALFALASLAACAGPSAENPRPPLSPAQLARPEVDPSDRMTPRMPVLESIERVAVRVRRGADGQATIVEFLNPSLTDADRVALRAQFEQGKLKLEQEGATGETWTTTLRPRSP
jgi:hypothetical protein